MSSTWAPFSTCAFSNNWFWKRGNKYLPPWFRGVQPGRTTTAAFVMYKSVFSEHCSQTKNKSVETLKEESQLCLPLHSWLVMIIFSRFYTSPHFEILARLANKGLPWQPYFLKKCFETPCTPLPGFVNNFKYIAALLFISCFSSVILCVFPLINNYFFPINNFFAN